MQGIKGWRTIAIGLVMAVAPAALTYLGGVDWTHLIGPNGALAVSGILMIAMRAITNTPPGQSS